MMWSAKAEVVGFPCLRERPLFSERPILFLEYMQIHQKPKTTSSHQCGSRACVKKLFDNIPSHGIRKGTWGPGPGHCGGSVLQRSGGCSANLSGWGWICRLSPRDASCERRSYSDARGVGSLSRSQARCFCAHNATSSCSVFGRHSSNPARPVCRGMFNGLASARNSVGRELAAKGVDTVASTNFGKFCRWTDKAEGPSIHACAAASSADTNGTAGGSGGPGMGLNSDIDYEFNMDEYMVTLDRPTGIRFAQRGDGVIYVHALARNGNAERSRMIMVGDVLKKATALFGDRMDDVVDFDWTMHAIDGPAGSISLVLERVAGKQEKLSAAAPATDMTMLPIFSGADDGLHGSLEVHAQITRSSSSPSRNGPFGVPGGGFFEKKQSPLIPMPGQVRYPARYIPQQEASASLAKDVGAGDFGFCDFAVLPYDDGFVRYYEDADGEDVEWTARFDFVEEYIEALRRFGSDLQYVHSQGMTYTQIAPELAVGSCIQSGEDLRCLRREIGVTAVLDLQMGVDHVNWGVSFEEIANVARDEGVVMVHHPIRGFDAEDLQARLPIGAAILFRLLRQGHRVYVMCTSGINRAPAVVIGYFHWIVGFRLGDAYDAVTSMHRSMPSRSALVGATWNLLFAYMEDGKYMGPPTHEVQILWNHGGREVLLAGEFGKGWDAPLPATHGGGSKWYLDLQVPQGKFRFKFIVDGQWRHAVDLPTEKDQWGNINNVIHVGTFGNSLLHGALPKGTSKERLIERPLTAAERRLLRVMAYQLAFSISPITFGPKI